MSNVVQFPRHKLFKCSGDTDPCYVGACMFCGGGLAYCVTCKGGEAELPTDCPGEPMHPDEKAAVMNGHVDFKAGRWVCVSAEAQQPMA
jgi:hypothetical protein